MRKTKNRLSSYAYKFRHIANHPSKQQYHQYANKYANKIQDTKKEHWEEWLNNITDKNLFSANKIVTDLPSDYMRMHIPPLKVGSSSIANSNQAKSAAFARIFFPPHQLCPTFPSTPLTQLSSHLPDSSPKTRSKERSSPLAPTKPQAQMGYPTLSLLNVQIY